MADYLSLFSQKSIKFRVLADYLSLFSQNYKMERDKDESAIQRKRRGPPLLSVWVGISPSVM